MKNSELLPETQFVLELIEKVSSNSKDAMHGKKRIDIYRQLSKEAVNELKEDYKVVSWESTKQVLKPSDGVYHTIIWK